MFIQKCIHFFLKEAVSPRATLRSRFYCYGIEQMGKIGSKKDATFDKGMGAQKLIGQCSNTRAQKGAPLTMVC